MRKGDMVVFHFSGVVVCQNNVLISFPKGYVLPREEDERNQHIRVFLQALIRYSREGELEPYQMELFGGEDGERESFEAAFWLLDDYIQHGSLSVQKQQNAIVPMGGAKHIHWAKTLQTIPPLISNGQVFYANVVNRYATKDLQNEIVRIYRHVIGYCMENYGWLLGFEYEEGLFAEKELPFEKEYVLQLVDLAAQKTFVDRERQIYRCIKRILRGSGEKFLSEKKYFTFCTLYFYHVWERMCRFVLADDLMEELHLPRPYWKVRDRVSYTRQIPDILFRGRDNEIYIADAKYYQTKDAPKGLPGWGDLVKQFFYLYTLQNEMKNIVIYNLFIFPSRTEKIVDYMGYATVDGDDVFGRVEGFWFDLYEVMKLYAFNQKGNIKERLVQMHQQCCCHENGIGE
ncbi:UNVERIFIED_ORG: LlaJI restriction endonuclease [Anoxybacillus amylolyticus]